MIRLIRQLGRVSVRAVSIGAIAVLCMWEGYSALPYKDIAGVWTNGHGNTHNVGPRTPPVSREQAKADLTAHLDTFGEAVAAALTREPTQGMWDAYLLLAYNIGPAAFRSSSTAKAHNAGDFYGACLYMLRWNKVTQNGVLVFSRGVQNRRFAEYEICVSGIPNVGYRPRRN